MSMCLIFLELTLISQSVTFGPLANPDAPFPINIGVLGITRITRTLSPKTPCNRKMIDSVR